MRTFTSDGTFQATGRGTVYLFTMPDPPIVMGDEVIIDGVTGKVTGIESHCVDWGKDPGQPVGILLGP